MKRNCKYFLCLFFVCISVISGIAGCAYDDGGSENKTPDEGNGGVVTEYYEVVLESTLYSGGGNFIALCRTLDEFREVCISNGYDFFNSGNTVNSIYNTEEGEQLRRLTDKDFEDSAFIVCGLYRSSDPGQYRIEDVEVEDDELTLYISYPRSDTANDVEVYMFFVVKVDALSVSDIKESTYIIC